MASMVSVPSVLSVLSREQVGFCQMPSLQTEMMVVFLASHMYVSCWWIFFVDLLAFRMSTPCLCIILLMVCCTQFASILLRILYLSL